MDNRRPFVPPVVLKYVLRYADGETAEIEAVLEKHVDHWLVDEAGPLEGAQLGWSRPFDESGEKRAAIYSMQAANPRPSVEIESIDVVRGGNRATPAVLGITLGEILAEK